MQTTPLRPKQGYRSASRVLRLMFYLKPRRELPAIADLAREFHITDNTIRADLRCLAEAGVLLPPVYECPDCFELGHHQSAADCRKALGRGNITRVAAAGRRARRA